MPPTFTDPDPYADLDYRADAGELSEEFRRRVRVRNCGRKPAPDVPMPRRGRPI